MKKKKRRGKKRRNCVYKTKKWKDFTPVNWLGHSVVRHSCQVISMHEIWNTNRVWENGSKGFLGFIVLEVYERPLNIGNV